MSIRTAVVVGNPKPESRTLKVAINIARALTDSEPDLVLDLVTLGPDLLDWNNASMSKLVEEVGSADLVIVGSPTYKATYTGMLKVFLDRFPAGTGLNGVAVPLMLGAGFSHALAAEVHLRPLLVELGASVPTPALYLLDLEFDRPESYDDWLVRSRPLVQAVLASKTGARA